MLINHNSKKPACALTQAGLCFKFLKRFTQPYRYLNEYLIIRFNTEPYCLKNPPVW